MTFHNCLPPNGDYPWVYVPNRKQVKYHGSWFTVDFTANAYNDAMTQCTNIGDGVAMAALMNEDENSAVMSLVPQGKRVYLGGFTNAPEFAETQNDWFWLDAPLTRRRTDNVNISGYTNWATGYP